MLRHQQQREHRRRTRGYDGQRFRPQCQDCNNDNHGEGDDSDNCLMVFFEIEAMQGDQRSHIPNLVVAGTNQSNVLKKWYGTNCIVQFITWLDDLVKGDVEDDNDEIGETILTSESDYHCPQLSGL